MHFICPVPNGTTSNIKQTLPQLPNVLPGWGIKSTTNIMESIEAD